MIVHRRDEPFTSRRVLYDLARARADERRDTLALSERALTRLCTARDTVADRRDFSAWGSLAPSSVPQRDASDELVEWAAEHLAGFARARELGSTVTRPSRVFVSSQHTSRSLKRYAEHRAPTAPGYDLQLTPWCDDDSLAALQRIARRHGDRGLEAVPHWRHLAFVLHDAHHWSLLLYSRSCDDATLEQSRLLHYDSVAGSPHAHNALLLTQLLKTLGLVRPDVRASRFAGTSLQNGGWQCGYAVMARLVERAGGSTARRLPSALRAPHFRANSVLDSESVMRDFLAHAVQRAELAAEMGRVYKRLDRIYVERGGER